MDSWFWNKPYEKNENTETPEINTQSFLNQKVPIVNGVLLLENCNLLSTYHFGINNRKSQFQASIVSALDNFDTKNA